MTSCPPLKAKVSVGIRSKTVVTIGAPSLPPKSVVGLSEKVTVRVDHGQNIPSQRSGKLLHIIIIINIIIKITNQHFPASLDEPNHSQQALLT